MRHRIGASRVAADRTARLWTSRLLASPALRWRYGAAIADRLLIQPQDLRPCDPAFVSELATGWLRLDGIAVDVSGDGPFEQPHLSPAHRAELDGFGWLRHLKEAGTPAARNEASRLIGAWLGSRHQRQSRQGLEPSGTTARRLLSWLTVADFVAAGEDDDLIERLLDTFADARVSLAAHWRSATAGAPRVLAAVALAVYDTVIDERHEARERSLTRLATALAQSTCSDGGALSRNGRDTMDMVFDLLTLRYAMLARDLPAEPWLAPAVDQAVATLRHVTLGDGSLARFNGVGPGVQSDVMRRGLPPGLVAHGPVRDGYARLERAGTVVVADVGAAPPIAVAEAAGSGCLAIEITVGRQRVIGNAAGSRRSPDWRASSAHATLTLGGRSSGDLVPVGELATSVLALQSAGQVRIITRPADEGDAVLAAAHDGYIGRHGLRHTRRLVLSGSGDRLEGVDALAAPSGAVRLKHDVPFAIYFHIEPGVEASLRPADRTVELVWWDCDRRNAWLFRLERGASLFVEASPAGPRGGQLAIVLRGATFGESEAAWSLERLDAVASAGPDASADAAAPLAPDAGNDRG